LYRPIATRSSSLGVAPGAGSPLNIIITRMSCLLPVRAEPRTVSTEDGVRPHECV
jgi:hypothetical protein